LGFSRPAVSKRSSSDTTADAFSPCGVNSSRPSDQSIDRGSLPRKHMRSQPSKGVRYGPKPFEHEVNPRSTSETNPLRRPIKKGAVARSASGAYSPASARAPPGEKSGW
jgi:hypothetical protein